MLGEKKLDFIQFAEKEVNQLNPKKMELEIKRFDKKKLKTFAKVCALTLATSASIFMLVHPAMAATTQTVVANTNVSIPAVSSPLLPSDIKEIGLYLIGLIAVASTLGAIIAVQLAGGWKILKFGKDKAVKEANDWTTQIMKGYLQVLLAPVLILVLAIIVYLLFQNFPFFAKPF
jgi:hypothetical protein